MQCACVCMCMRMYVHAYGVQRVYVHACVHGHEQRVLSLVLCVIMKEWLLPHPSDTAKSYDHHRTRDGKLEGKGINEEEPGQNMDISACVPGSYVCVDVCLWVRESVCMGRWACGWAADI